MARATRQLKILEIIAKYDIDTQEENSLELEYSFHAIVSSGMLKEMQRKYAQCKQMMEVTDEDIDAYREQRQQIDKGMKDDDASGDSLENRFIEIQSTIEAAKEKLKLE